MRFCGFMMLALCIGASVSAEDLPTPPRAEIKAVRDDATIGWPNAQAMLQANATEEQKDKLLKYQEQLIKDPGTPATGSTDANVTIVEFFDYQCPYCKTMQPMLQGMLGNDNKLRIAYKDLALLGPTSALAARAGLAAVLQHKYEPFHRALLASNGPLSEDDIYKVAGSVGIDVDRLKKDMKSPEVYQKMEDNAVLANALNIQGTPTFVIGDQLIEGGIDKARLKELISATRKQRGKPLGNGIQ